MSSTSKRPHEHLVSGEGVRAAIARRETSAQTDCGCAARGEASAGAIADDIMETFDHFRAEEALRLFAEMGRVGQVIYFTHHQHLAEIATAVRPEARVHELK